MSVDQIVRLDAQRYDRARRALAEAFFEYILMLYVAPDAARRRRGVPMLYGAILSDCFHYGEVHVTRSGVGAACWLPPERAHATLWRQIRCGMLGLPFRFGLASFRRLLAYDAVTQKLHHEHARMPHWYLAVIGVEPEYQGQGIGGALLQPILSLADAEHVACYLDTHREENVRLYQRHGFEVACRAEVPGHRVPLWAMLRPPR